MHTMTTFAPAGGPSSDASLDRRPSLERSIGCWGGRRVREGPIRLLGAVLPTGNRGPPFVRAQRFAEPPRRQEDLHLFGSQEVFLTNFRCIAIRRGMWLQNMSATARRFAILGWRD